MSEKSWSFACEADAQSVVSYLREALELPEALPRDPATGNGVDAGSGIDVSVFRGADGFESTHGWAAGYAIVPSSDFARRAGGLCQLETYCTSTGRHHEAVYLDGQLLVDIWRVPEPVVRVSPAALVLEPRSAADVLDPAGWVQRLLTDKHGLRFSRLQAAADGAECRARWVIPFAVRASRRPHADESDDDVPF